MTKGRLSPAAAAPRGALDLPAPVTRAFAELTPRGQVRRLRALAAMHSARTTSTSRAARSRRSAFNTVFRVDAADGSSYALRVSPALRIHADGCEEAEAAWVTALRRDVGFPTPAVIPARDGAPVVWASAPGVPEPRSCVLFEWLGGTTLRRRMTVDGIRQTGVLGGAGARARGRVRDRARLGGALVADRVLYFRVADRLEELRPDVRLGARRRSSPAPSGRSTSCGGTRPIPPHLLHGDLQSGNVLVARGRASLIDFQDLIWGFEIHRRRVRAARARRCSSPGGRTCWAAFRAGLRGAVRPWPEADREVVGGADSRPGT